MLYTLNLYNGICQLYLNKAGERDFPADLGSLKNLPSNAEDGGLSPGREARIPHATGPLSPSTTTREAHMLQQRPSKASKSIRLSKKKPGEREKRTTSQKWNSRWTAASLLSMWVTVGHYLV